MNKIETTFQNQAVSTIQQMTRLSVEQHRDKPKETNECNYASKW